MALDPQAQAIADQFAHWPAPDFNTLTAADYRAGLAAMMAPPPPLHPEVQSNDIVLPTPGADLGARVYRPALDGKLPVVVYLHGGGFVSCGLETHDNLCRRLCAHSEALVVSVDYRLAPEHPFPAAVNDAVAAIRTVYQMASDLGADFRRMALAGDSAGATLATVAARLLRGTDVAIAHQLLIYPATDAACDSASCAENAHAPILSTALMRWFWRQYLGSEENGLDPRAAPLRAQDLSGMPATTVITAGHDPLRDEGEAYGQALVTAGVPVTTRRWPGQFHGFASLLGGLDAADEALAFAARQLRAALQP